MNAPKPSLELLRGLTDENVLRALMAHDRLTRAEIATRTGISKPTISDSVQRLEQAQLIVDTGERTTGRGRVGSYYALAPQLGTALVASITPHGVIAEAVDAHGRAHGQVRTALEADAGQEVAAKALAAAAMQLGGQVGGRLRLAVVSAADPVDRATGRLVHLPDAPFLVGALDPPAVLAETVTGPVLVDNDVNWAARAEYEHGCAQGVDDFVYLHLGEGLGCAVVSDGVVRRGHRGLVGEIAHLYTAGPDGQAMSFTEVFAALDLRRASSTAIDVPKLVEILEDTAADAARVHAALARAISGVLSAALSLADPQTVVVGGSWGVHPRMLTAIEEHFTRSPRSVPVRAAYLPLPELTGARARAVDELGSLIVRAAHPTTTW
ncbi:ROK family transcriptional regulator [Streptomyces sp. NBC_01239]|uniref:ROK family transcriptional regulator n=1 Tax=Streptomyces sp. NBC_01239 TaxID=2903792 RepID=UPI00224D7122|nr:ROK family transcriptional regulator [Streptomyces sp. NBC_01239]MCX4816373.1 ROK family transcriptional regulator [Streptomyces sp. NBC_01239]